MKKTLRAISLLLSFVLLISMIGPFSVFAEEAVYTMRGVTAYVFKAENVRTIDCLFSDQLPDVPYIDPVDYLNVIFKDVFAQKKNEDGTFAVYSNRCSMMFDVQKETVFSESFDDVFSSKASNEGSSITVNFTREISSSSQQPQGGKTLDLARYGFDLIEYEGKVYVPLNLLSVIFSCSYNNATYFNGVIYFFTDMDDGSYFASVDKSVLYNTLERGKEMAEFTYQTLCFAVDNFYGRPSNCPLHDSIVQKGLDRTLDETDDTTRLAKQLMLSESAVDFVMGFSGLTNYLFDGGHTDLFNFMLEGYAYYPESLIIEKLRDEYRNGTPGGQLFYTVAVSSDVRRAMREQLSATRDQEYAKYLSDLAKVWEDGNYLIVRGDTAVFVFDRFLPNTPAELKEALDCAKEKGAKNFILDVSCNVGGLVASCGYIFTLIANEKYHNNVFAMYTEETFTGSLYTVESEMDLNLDGVFDDKDKEFCYDFNFGVLSSWASFSSGNILPVRSKEAGIAILGDTSGGGACIATNQYLPGGYKYANSAIYKNVLPGTGVDFDLGAAPDYVLTVTNEDGSIDYSGLYDIDRLGDLVEAFYASGAEPEAEPVAYTVTNGENAEWTAGSGKDLSITSNADFDKFTAVKVDGVEIDAKNYTVAAGSTKVTLKAAYLETLAAGEHTLTVVSADGEATTKFTVLAAADPSVKPVDSGDRTDNSALIVLALISLCVMLVSVSVGRKKKVFR